MTPGRSHRSLFLLAASLGIQILLLAAQVKRDSDVPLLRVWAVEALAPFGRSATWLVDSIHTGWTNYIGVHSLGRENQQLHAELDQLKLRNAELESRAAEADRLAKLLDFRQRNSEVPMVAARVIGASPSTGSRVVFLDRGSRDGLDLDMGVITPDGVVGKLIAVYPDTSQVLLLSDKESGVGALLANSRTQAPVRGSGDPLLNMEYVAKDVTVTPGEIILTSGQDQIFPKDLPVGVVQTVRPDPHSPFQKIVVKSAARLDSLEEVLVLLTRHELTHTGAPDVRAEESTAAKPAAPPASPAARSAAPAIVSAPVKPPVAAPAPAPPKPAAAIPAPAGTPAPKEPTVAPLSPTTSEPAPADARSKPSVSAPAAQENAPKPAEGGGN
jgi:rod shape-determining protein MreC